VVERFLREARATAQLKGEHVCRVSDVGTVDGKPYFVMELLDGIDLAKLMVREGTLPASRACAYVLQACAGAAEAHALGIVHRDLKPSNLFLTKRTDGSPLIKVLDFGVATAPHGDAPANLTQTTNVLGSPGYMSPEQLRSSKIVDARADIWALGTILYELIVGRPPFHADSLTELALKIGMDPTPSVSGAPPELDGVVARCLMKEARDRFADVGELASALGPFAATEVRDAASAIRAVLAAGPTERDLAPPTVRMRAASRDPETFDRDAERVTTLGRATGERTSHAEDRRRRRWPWLVAASVVAAGGATLAVVAGGGGSSAEPERQPLIVMPAAPPAHGAAAPVAPAVAPDAAPADATPADAAPIDAVRPDAPKKKHAPPKPRPAHDKDALEEPFDDSRI
jgi:serine/threonine-protein kinase